MSHATDWARGRQKSDASRPALVIPGYPDPVATVTDQGNLCLPHDTMNFDAAAALTLAQWIHDTFA